MARITSPKARSAELPRNEPTNILARLEQENNQMQRRLDRFHTIQKARKHLKGKAQERAIKSINEITVLDDERDIQTSQIQAMMIFKNFYLQTLDVVVNVYTFCAIHNVVVNV